MENLGNLFKVHVSLDRLAAIDLLDIENPKEITYGELDSSCDALARGLVRRGLGVGDRIAILSENRVEFIEVLFGALRAGCVPVPINIKLSSDVVRIILEDAEVKHVFTDSSRTPWPLGDLPHYRNRHHSESYVLDFF